MNQESISLYSPMQLHKYTKMWQATRTGIAKQSWPT